MRKLITILFILMMASFASAISLERQAPSTVTAGQSFTVRYVVLDVGEGNFGVLITDDISGGCTPAHVATGFLSPATTQDITYTAPSGAGSCTFTGDYQFADETGTLPQQNFAPTTVTISSGQQQPPPDTGDDDDDTDNTLLYVVLGFFGLIIAGGRGGRRG